MGAKADIEMKNRDPNNPLQQERIAKLKKLLLDKLQSPETLLLLMDIGLDQLILKKMQAGSIRATEKLEQIRSAWQSQIRDNDLLRRAILACISSKKSTQDS